MPLSPEEAAALGLPPVESLLRPQRLSPEEARALGLPEVPQTLGYTESGVRGALQGASLGWADEGAAFFDALIPGASRLVSPDVLAGAGPDAGFSERYQTARDFYRSRNARAQEENPKTYLGGEVGGALATTLVAPGRAVAQAPTLVPRLVQAGKTGAKIGAVAGAGSSESETAAGVAADTAIGAGTGAVVAPVAEAGITAVKAGARWVGKKAGQLANDAARRSTGATQVDITKLTRENPKRPEMVGDALLDEPIRLRSPKTIGQDAKKLKATVGQEIGDLIDVADSSGAQFDVGGFMARAQADVLNPLRANLAQQLPQASGNVANPAAERVGALLAAVQKKASANNGVLRVADAHQLRKDLDVLLRGVNKSQDPSSTVVKDAINDIRGILSDEIGSTMQRAGVGDAWARANERFGLAADITKLAKKGQDRRLGNNALFGFTQQVSGAGPGSVIGAISNPDDRVAGALGGAALGMAGTRALQNYGAPVTARTAQAVSRLLSRAPVAPGSPIPAEVAALIRAMEQEPRVVLRPVPAAADEERRK